MDETVEKMPNRSKDQMIRGIDLVKFILAIIVVGGHCFPLDDRPGFLGVLIDLLWEIPVPYFFIATGYSIFSKIPENSSPAIVSRKLKVRIFGYARMYIYWVLIYFPIEYFGYRDSSLSLGAYAFAYIKRFVFDGRNFYSWQLWYLLSTVYGLLVLFLLIRWKRILVLSSVLIFLSSAFLYWMMTFAWPLYEGQPVIVALRQLYYFEKMPFSVLYLCIGMLFAQGKIRVSKWGALLIVSISLFVLGLKLPVVTQVMPVFVVSMLFWLSCSMALKPHVIWVKLRKASAIIYFSHLLILYVVAIRILALPNYSVMTFVFVLGCSIALSWFVIVSGNRYKWMRIFGG